MAYAKQSVIGVAAVLAVLPFAGCAPSSGVGLYDAWQDDPAGPALADQARADDETMPASHPSSALGTAAGPDDYVRLALERNPSIRAAQRRVERLGARVPQATSLDDPMLQVAPFGEMAQTAAGQVGVMAGVSQKLPLPGKLRTRGAIAEQDVAVALAELQQARLRVIADTRQAYWSYDFATRALDTTRRSRALLDQFKQIAEAEYRAGNRSQPDVLRASTELSSVDSELITLRQRRATARGMLNRLMDRPPSAPLPEPGAVELEQIDAGIDELLARAATTNPALAKARERIEQSRQRQKLARLSRWPDLTVSANYNAVDDEGLAPSANGDDQWWFGFGVNLPIWAHKYEAAEREALRGRLESVAELSAEQNRIAFEVQEAYLKVEAQQELVELFRDTIVPQARQTVEASRSGYRAGSVDFLTLMDNWRKLLNFELMQHRAVAEMEQAVAELERAVGGSLARKPANPPAPTDDQENQ